ncbi:uncharacterized protein BCR38DRAFT_242695 [Pseudomassariella vexata]|uniref:Uncharacterized protein n=1 Tax=Pseudomassariella vexata TaxID=1141098 RepID=A0A1Y2DTU1_9PEZI|nr:uncharacterized protein BCR38DRAFT_242695 [Pseudomassariella vexata]ORY62556.1 hypothetical protein BCR38DRAFT_242695 [Pseudomassariella vexata]
MLILLCILRGSTRPGLKVRGNRCATQSTRRGTVLEPISRCGSTRERRTFFVINWILVFFVSRTRNLDVNRGTLPRVAALKTAMADVCCAAWMHIHNMQCQPMAANSLSRSTFGAAFPLWGKWICERLGKLWTAIVPAFLNMVNMPSRIVCSGAVDS